VNQPVFCGFIGTCESACILLIYAWRVKSACILWIYAGLVKSACILWIYAELVNQPVYCGFIRDL
jgi:hypothetical protein